MLLARCGGRQMDRQTNRRPKTNGQAGRQTDGRTDGERYNMPSTNPDLPFACALLSASPPLPELMDPHRPHPRIQPNSVSQRLIQGLLAPNNSLLLLSANPQHHTTIGTRRCMNRMIFLVSFVRQRRHVQESVWALGLLGSFRV